jgi:hypothetical protein
MKTPREILFQRHEAAGPKLDAIRHAVVARHCRATENKQAVVPTGFFARLWLELFWSCRRVWTGLAFVWVVLVLVNLSQRDSRPAHAQLASSPPTAEMVMALHRQEAELLADRSGPAEAIKPRRFEPAPRSEMSGITVI